MKLFIFLLYLPLTLTAQDSTTLNHLPKCLDSLKTKNDSTTTIFFHVDKRYKINLVPVNSTTTIEKEKLENELNKIYYPYGVSISLNVLNKIEDKSWDINNDGKLDVGETGILNFRTEEMKAVHRLNENKKAEEIYLYLMQTPSKEGVEGDMPLGSQYGFLFGEPSARTLSHEIAHGYFQLKHSFDESIALQKSSTNNLMDYANGNTLYKYQWDLVHDKGLMIAKLWQSDSAGEALLVDNLIGAGIGALVEVSIQVATNVYEKYYEKKPNIDIFKIKWWPQVAIASGVGFVSSGASSMIKFTKFATSPIGQKALKIAIETSTDFLLGTISDVLIKYFENEPIEVQQTFINNLIGSSLFGTINNIVPLEKLKTALQNKFGKVKTILNEKIINKQNTYINNVYANTIVKIKNSKNKVVTKEEVRKKLLVKNKIIPDDPKIGDLNLKDEIKDATNEEIAKIEKEATETITENVSKEIEDDIAKKVNGAGRFIAKSGNELKTYLNGLVTKPLGKTYNGKFFKSVSKNAELNHNAKPDIISQYSIEEAWGRYDIQGESGMYYSKTLNGNQTEMSHYGDWNSYSTYEFSNVQIDNVLDLTDDVVRQQLGSEFNQLVLTTGTKAEMYEFTNTVGTWARAKGYKGLIVPGARGSQDYTNVIIFNQADLTNALNGITPIKLK